MGEEEAASASAEKCILDKSEFKDGKLDLSSPLVQPPKCPECTSQRVWRDGLRYTKNGDVQRWLCRNCGYRFSQMESKDPSRPLQKDSRCSINTAITYTLNRQVCELLTEDSKNLAEVETRTEKRAAGATKPTSAEVKSKIVEFAWWLKKKGRSEHTIEAYTRMLMLLTRTGCNLNNPESVRDALAQLDRSLAWKSLCTAAYTAFSKMYGTTWEPPTYKPGRKLPFIPTEQEIDALISSCGRKTAAFLQLLKETAMRAGEAVRLQWMDVDLERRIITLNKPEKGGNPRIFRISDKLAMMLGTLPKRHVKVFGNITLRGKTSVFRAARAHSAKKLGNPRLLRIRFHTLRHWKATVEYHKTKDILHVKELLGHRKIDTTTLYIQLDKALFQGNADEFTVRVAIEPEEIRSLLEVGFEYVCQKDQLAFFRKRK